MLQIKAIWFYDHEGDCGIINMDVRIYYELQNHLFLVKIVQHIYWTLHSLQDSLAGYHILGTIEREELLEKVELISLTIIRCTPVIKHLC